MKIYTITLNPAYDIHATTDHFEAFHECLATVTSRDAGGKGVNISKALYNFNAENTAVVVIGTENAQEFCNDIAHLNTILIKRDGRIRENLTLHSSGNPEMRISFRSFAVEDSVLSDIIEQMQVDENTVVAFTGRVPDGMTLSKVEEFLLQLKQEGAKIVLDSKSFDFDAICRIQPWLIKPNEEEIAEYLSCHVDNLADAAEKAKVFVRAGVENVMISMGDQGAALLTGETVCQAVPPAITPLSTVGAGDSSVAGFLCALAEGKDAAQMLKTAVAFGTAACLTEGSCPPEKKTIEHVFSKVKIVK